MIAVCLGFGFSGFSPHSPNGFPAAAGVASSADRGPPWEIPGTLEDFPDPVSLHLVRWNPGRFPITACAMADCRRAPPLPDAARKADPRVFAAIIDAARGPPVTSIFHRWISAYGVQFQSPAAPCKLHSQSANCRSLLGHTAGPRLSSHHPPGDLLDRRSLAGRTNRAPRFFNRD